MKIAVISDSHGYTDHVARLADRLVKAGISLAVHLGDDYDDAEPLVKAGLEVWRVPGVFSHYYQDPAVPNRILTELGGTQLLLTHADAPHQNDLPSDEDPAAIAAREKPDLVLFGHTHLPAIEKREGVLWVNPGHLKPEDKKGAPPTYAVIDMEARPVKVQIFSFEDDRVFLESE